MKILGYGLIFLGAAGAYSRYTVYQAAGAGNPSLVSSMDKFDPAAMVGFSAGSGLIEPGLLFDLALAGVGAWLVMKG